MGLSSLGGLILHPFIRVSIFIVTSLLNLCKIKYMRFFSLNVGQRLLNCQPQQYHLSRFDMKKVDENEDFEITSGRLCRFVG